MMRLVTSRVLLAMFLAIVLTGVALPAIAAIDAPGVTGEITFDGSPVAGADVEVLSSGIVVGTATTTLTGAYEVALATPGTFDVRVTPPVVLGVMAQTVRGVAVAGAASIAVVDVALRRPLGSTQVHVVDGTGAALAGLQVRLVGTAPAPLSVVDLAVTDSGGGVELRAPTGVDYELRVDAITGSAAAVPADLQLRVVERVQSTAVGTAVLLTLPTATLDVTTNRSGPVGVNNMVVAARGSMGGLDLGGGFTGSGSFESVGTTSTGGLVSLPVVEGPVFVQAFPSRDQLLLQASTNVTVAASPTPVSLLLGNAPTAPLSITLLDGFGVAVPGALVKASTSARTDAVGAAAVLVRTDQLTTVNVTALSDGVLDLPDRLTFTRVMTGGATETLQPVLANLTIDVIEDVSGLAITGALVSVSSPSVAAGPWEVRSIANNRLTDGSGRVVFRLVPGVTYDVTVTVGSTRIASDSVALAAAGSTSVVRLPDAPPTSGIGFVTISGRVVTPAGTGIAGLVVRSTRGGSASTTNANGDFAVRVSAVATHSLTISGTELLVANGFDAEVPDRLEVRIPDAATITGALDDVDIGDVVLPIDRLDVRVTDETGGGLFSLVARTPLSGGRSTAQINGAPVAVSASSGYVDAGVRLDRFGEGTMFLFGGTHQVTVGEESLTNFGDIDLPVTESASLTSGSDTLLLVLTRRFGTPVTSLTGTPLVSSTPTTLTLELPDARLTPLVQLAEPMLGATTATNVILTDRWFCGDSNTTIVIDPADCAEPVRDIELIENGIPAALGPGTYPIAARSFVFSPAFIQEGFRRSTLVLNAPIDEPPVLTDAVAVTPANEGSLTLLSASASDTEGPVVVAWDLDGDGVGDAEGESVWVDVPDGPSFTSFETIVTDSAGRSTRRSVDVESVNVAPTGTLTVTGPDPSGLVSVSVTDLDDPATADVATLTVEIDLDDDATFETAAASATIDASAFADGTYPVAARVLDKDGGVTTLTSSFLVAAPTSTTVAPTTVTPTTVTPTTVTPTTVTPTTVTPTTVTPTTVAPTTVAPTTAPPAVTSAPPTAPPPGDPLDTRLPETGGNALQLTISALGLLVIGGGLIAATRRRTSAPQRGLER